MNNKPEKLFDVISVNHKTSAIRIMATGKTLRNAEAIENMAIMRRGCEEEFFAVTDAGAYKEGDKWEGVE